MGGGSLGNPTLRHQPAELQRSASATQTGRGGAKGMDGDPRTPCLPGRHSAFGGGAEEREVPSHTPGAVVCEPTGPSEGLLLTCRLGLDPASSWGERAVRRTGHRVPYWWSPFGR